MSDIELAKPREHSLDSHRVTLVEEGQARSDDIISEENSRSISRRSRSIFTDEKIRETRSRSIFTDEKSRETVGDQVPEQVTDADVKATLEWSRGYMRLVFYILYGVHGFRHDKTTQSGGEEEGESIQVNPWITRVPTFVITSASLFAIFMTSRPDKGDIMMWIRYIFLAFVYTISTIVFYVYGGHFGVTLAKSQFVERLEEEVLTNITSKKSQQRYLRYIGIVHCVTIFIVVFFVVFAIPMFLESLITLVGSVALAILLTIIQLPFFALPCGICIHQSGVYIWLVMVRLFCTRQILRDERKKLENGEVADTALIKNAVYDHINDAEGLSKSWLIMNVARIAFIISKLSFVTVMEESPEGRLCLLYDDPKGFAVMFLEAVLSFTTVWLSLVVAGGSNHTFYNVSLCPFMMVREIDEKSELGAFLKKALKGRGVMGHKVMNVYLSRREVILVGTVSIFIVQAFFSLQKSQGS